jgi:hypothetical protein
VFEELAQRMQRYFLRQETSHRARSYLRGLLSSVERKNGWQIAEVVGAPTPYGVQHLLDRAKWDMNGMRDANRSCLAYDDPIEYS